MSMILTKNHLEAPRRTGLQFAFTIVATALLTMVLVPGAAIAISYAAGGAATSSILCVYLFALLTNGPILITGLALTIGTLVAPRVVCSLAHHKHV